MRAKKGMIAENMSEVGIAAVIIVIAVILLSIAANLNKTGKLENGRVELINAILQNDVALYLKQPVELPNYPDQIMTVADLTVLAAENPNDKKITGIPGKSYNDLWKEKTDYFWKNTNKV